MERPSAVSGFVLASVALVLVVRPPALAGTVSAKPSLTLEGARRIIATARTEAAQLEAPGAVIAVVDDGGNLLALERLDGTFAAGANVSIGKARTAALFRKPTRVFEEIVNKGRTSMTALSDFTPLQGGVPIDVGGHIVGAIGVSGAASAQQDEDIAVAGAAAARGFMQAEPGGNDATLHYGSDTVAAAFAKGTVLYDGNGGRNYMVHASRRDKAGMAEVHALDTDVIYVLGGAASLVTGGDVIDGKNVEPGEVRGRSIRGGTTRRLAGGDVVVVPNGTPHWFAAVDAPFTYFVVKVR